MEKQVENRLTALAVAYMEMLEGSTMLLRLLEEGAKAAKSGLKREQKQRLGRILNHLAALRQLTADDPFLSEHQAFAADWYKYDDFRKDAAYFARLVLWLSDRTFQDEPFAAQVETFIKTKAEKGVFPAELVESLRIK